MKRYVPVHRVNVRTRAETETFLPKLKTGVLSEATYDRFIRSERSIAQLQKALMMMMIICVYMFKAIQAKKVFVIHSVLFSVAKLRLPKLRILGVR